MLFLEYLSGDENEFSSDVINEINEIVGWIREERDQYASHEFFHDLLVQWLEVAGEQVEKGKGSKQSAFYIRREYREQCGCKSILSAMHEDEELLVLYPQKWKGMKIDPLVRQLLTFKALSFRCKNPREFVSLKLLKWKLLCDLIERGIASIHHRKKGAEILLSDEYLAEAKMLSEL
jgi:hypothetical protein